MPGSQVPTAGDLVAVTLPPGPGWAELIASLWDAGAALLPVDPRLPATEIRALLARARPTAILDAGGLARTRGGVPSDPGTVVVIHTSGTAGVPKLVEFDRAAIDAAVASSALALEATPRDRWLCCLPLAHVGGLLVLLRGVLLGAPITVHRGFDVDEVRTVREAAFVSLVPTMLLRLLDAGVDLTGFRAILVGGAAAPPELLERARAEGANVVETYGLTESCGGVVYDGRPLPGTQARIDPANQGIELLGPTLMRGYRFDAEASAAALTPDGWLRPGDAGWFGDDGRLHVIGRLDELINSGGERVWPQEVEVAISTHPKVAAVAVVGRQDPEWGQRVVAFVVPADADDPPMLDELREHSATTLARFKAPRELVLVPELPRTTSGKIRRASLP